MFQSEFKDKWTNCVAICWLALAFFFFFFYFLLSLYEDEEDCDGSTFKSIFSSSLLYFNINWISHLNFILTCSFKNKTQKSFLFISYLIENGCCCFYRDCFCWWLFFSFLNFELTTHTQTHLNCYCQCVYLFCICYFEISIWKIKNRQ